MLDKNFYETYFSAIKKPCVDCPFLKNSSTNRTLDKGRIESIIDSLHDDNVFSCHKTVNYEKDTTIEEYEETTQLENMNKFCAGAISYLVKEGKPNTPIQLASRLGYLDIDIHRDREGIIDVIPMKMPWEKRKMVAAESINNNNQWMED